MSDPQTNPPTGSTPPPPPPPPPANPASSSSDSDAERRKAELLAALERDEASARAGASSSSPPSSSTPSPTPPLEDRAGFLTEDPPAKPEGLETSPSVAGAEQVQQRVDEETARGFIGTKVEPLPDSAYTLESGPDAPANVPDAQTRVTQHALDATVRPPSSSSSSS